MAKTDPGLALRRSARPSPRTSLRPASWRQTLQEVESGKRDRLQHTAALTSCRIRRAVLVVVKPDWLARNAKPQLREQIAWLTSRHRR